VLGLNKIGQQLSVFVPEKEHFIATKHSKIKEFPCVQQRKIKETSSGASESMASGNK
jgi:hypothetical protein